MLVVRPKVSLTFIILLGIALRIIFFSGYNSGDDCAYIAKAYNYSVKGLTAPLDHWEARMGIVLPTALCYLLLGVSEFSTAIIPLLFSICGIALSYLIGKQLFDVTIGLLSALLIAMFPLDVIFASHLYPYAAISTLSATAFYFFVRYDTGEQIKWFLFLSGVFIGLAYLCRITSLYCLFFYISYIIWARRFNKRYLLIGAGLVLVVGIELVFYYMVSGTPWCRFAILMNKIGIYKTRVSEGHILNQAMLIKLTPVFIKCKWYIEPFARLFLEMEFGVYFYWILPIAIYQLIWGKSRKVKILLLWIIPLFLYLSYGSTSPLRYRPLIRHTRYLSIIIVPAMVLLAYQLARFSNKKLLVSLGLLASTSVLCLWLDNSRYVTASAKEIYAFYKQHPRETFIVARPLYFDLLFFERFAAEKRLLVMVHPHDKSHSWRRIRSVYPEVPVISRIRNIHRGYIVTRGSYYGSDALVKMHNVQYVQQFLPPDRIYFYLLKNPVILKILKYTRNSRRYKNLTSHRQKKYTLYRVY